MKKKELIQIKADNFDQAYIKSLLALNKSGKLKELYSKDGQRLVQKDIRLSLSVKDINELGDFFEKRTKNNLLEQQDQIDFIVKELVRNKESRRAVMMFNDDENILELVFQIRENKLNLFVFTNSTDAGKLEMVDFIELQKQMVEKIKASAPSNYAELKPGSYNHEAVSYHLNGEILNEKDYRKYLLDKEGITLEEDKNAIFYKHGYVVGEIRELEKKLDGKELLNDEMVDDFGIQTTSGKTLAESYNNALVLLDKKGKIYPCDDYSTEYIKKVQKEIPLHLVVENVNEEPIISKFFLSGPDALQDYELEFLYGVRDFNVKAYELGLEPNFWPYTYHQRMYQNDQIDRAIDNLIFGGQGIIVIRDNKVDMNVSDPACLQTFVLEIDDDELNMVGLMRSNDATEASGMNMKVFIDFQKRLVEQIKNRIYEYLEKNPEKLPPRSVSLLKLKAGRYDHIDDSFHAYGEVLKKDDYLEYLNDNSLEKPCLSKENEKRYEKESFELLMEYCPQNPEEIEEFNDMDRKIKNRILKEQLLSSEFTIGYEDGYVVGEIWRLRKNTDRIQKSNLEDLTYQLEGEYGWKKMMHDRICPSLAELTIAKSIEYGLFDQKQISTINNVLNDYNIPASQLVSACQERGIDLVSEYQKAGMELEPKVKKKSLRGE